MIQRPSAPGWAVLVGIDEYVDQLTHPPLRCCVRDAIALYVVMTHHDYTNLAADRVVLMVDGSKDDVRAAAQGVVKRLEVDYNFPAREGLVEEIVSKRLLPHREDILAEMHRVCHNAAADDLLLVHFAGHGYIFDGDMYLIPPAARHPLYAQTAISLQWVKQAIEHSEAHDKLLLLDACCGLGATTVGRPTNVRTKTTIFEGTNDVAIFASSLPWEQSFEYDDLNGGRLHGIFTYYLVDALIKRVGEGPGRLVTLDHVAAYVTSEVKTWVAANVRQGPLQTPALNDAAARLGSGLILCGDRHQRSHPAERSPDVLPPSPRYARSAVAASLVVAAVAGVLYSLAPRGFLSVTSPTSTQATATIENALDPTLLQPDLGLAPKLRSTADVKFRFRLRGNPAEHELTMPFQWEPRLSAAYEYALRIRSHVRGTLFVFRLEPNRELVRVPLGTVPSGTGIRLTPAVEVSVPIEGRWEAVGQTVGRRTLFLFISRDDETYSQRDQWWTRDVDTSPEQDALVTELRALAGAEACDPTPRPCVVGLTFDSN